MEPRCGSHSRVLATSSQSQSFCPSHGSNLSTSPSYFPKKTDAANTGDLLRIWGRLSSHRNLRTRFSRAPQLQPDARNRHYHRPSPASPRDVFPRATPISQGREPRPTEAGANLNPNAVAVWMHCLAREPYPQTPSRLGMNCTLRNASCA